MHVGHEPELTESKARVNTSLKKNLHERTNSSESFTAYINIFVFVIIKYQAAILATDDRCTWKIRRFVLKSRGVFKGADEMLQTFYHLLVSPRNIITCPSMPTVLRKAGERTDATWRGQAGSTAIVTASRPCWHLVFGVLSFVGRRRRQRHKIFTKQSCFTMLESSFKRSSSQNKGWQTTILNPSKKNCLLS